MSEERREEETETIEKREKVLSLEISTRMARWRCSNEGSRETKRGGLRGRREISS